jgi:hypothetical protein
MLRHILLTLAVLAAGVGPLSAQVEDPPAEVATDTLLRLPTPGGAFVRSLVIPGWGQAPFGAYTRGGIYFAGWTGTWFMNFKNQVRLTEARNRLDLRGDQVRAILIAESPNPDSMRAVLDTTNVLDQALQADEIASGIRDLVRSREQQREDWIALSIFWVLAAGIDAFVTAHLADFPAVIDLEPNADRSVSLRVEVPFPRRRP